MKQGRSVLAVTSVTAVLAAVVALATMPGEAAACPFCFDSSAENRMAFLVTAAALTALPLGMVSGVGVWLRRKFKAREREES